MRNDRIYVMEEGLRNRDRKGKKRGMKTSAFTSDKKQTKQMKQNRAGLSKYCWQGSA